MNFRLSDLDGEYAAMLPRAEYLPQGMYVLRVTGATYEERDHAAFIGMIVEVVTPGPLWRRKYNWLLYVEDAATAAWAGQRLLAMGVDLEAGGLLFSEAFVEAAKELKGLCFWAHKRIAVRPSGHVIHHLNIIRPWKDGESLDPRDI